MAVTSVWSETKVDCGLDEALLKGSLFLFCAVRRQLFPPKRHPDKTPVQCTPKIL